MTHAALLPGPGGEGRLAIHEREHQADDEGDERARGAQGGAREAEQQGGEGHPEPERPPRVKAGPRGVQGHHRRGDQGQGAAGRRAQDPPGGGVAITAAGGAAIDLAAHVAGETDPIARPDLGRIALPRGGVVGLINRQARRICVGLDAQAQAARQAQIEGTGLNARHEPGAQGRERDGEDGPGRLGVVLLDRARHEGRPFLNARPGVPGIAGDARPAAVMRGEPHGCDERGSQASAAGVSEEEFEGKHGRDG